MKTYRVTFTDDIRANNEKEAYSKLIEYLAACAKYGDVDAFEFKEVQE